MHGDEVMIVIVVLVVLAALVVLGAAMMTSEWRDELHSGEIEDQGIRYKVTPIMRRVPADGPWVPIEQEEQ